MVHPLKTRVARKARAASTHLQSILSTNLAARRQEASRHEEQLKKKKEREEEYKRKYAELWKLALKGARNMVALHSSEEMQEMLRVLAQVRGGNYEFILHESDADYGGEFLAWRWTRCRITMTTQDVEVFVQQVGQREVGKSEAAANLTSPRYFDGEGDMEWTLEEELGVILLLFAESPEWVVESIRAVEKWEGEEKVPENLPYEWQRMSWLAFLIRCADKRKLAKIMEDAFERLENEA